ncbi:uncharacterized protein LOC100679572 [Nasonia vitripennis]|uniref:Nucleolus and neural progenitor protein-like N-terminal domain-containing protein n=1 Tax=Nasonia vitripennis TaxID=7425 RepID=A0A7M7GCL9_NASVI|nr:uncharacterized protein LOC100679572 [Nasonia vitripennis]
MEILWNQINLQRPPYRSWDVSVTEFDSKRFIDSIDKILSDFKTFQVLHAEAALLSRLIYRMKSKFRSDKGLKHMEKVNRALLNYLNMAMEREYELLKEYIEINNGIISLPPRQTLEYVLVRTQGFAKLMCRVESTALIAGNFLKSRLCIGQSWTVAMIAYAVISRIWILSRHVIKKSCNWYNSIFDHMKNFKTVGISWLPDNYILPENLAEWLDLPWFNEDMEKLPIKENWDKSIFSLMKANDADEEDLNIANDTIPKNLTAISEDVNCQNDMDSVQMDVDLGQPISRLAFEETNQEEKRKKPVKVKKKKRNPKKFEKLLQVESEADLVTLLKIDSFPGLDKLQLNILQKQIKKLLLKLTEKNTRNLDEEMLKKIRKGIKKWTSS